MSSSASVAAAAAATLQSPILVLALVATVTLAHYVPPSYYSNYGSGHGDHGHEWGGRGADYGRYHGGWRDRDYGHQLGDRSYYGQDYGKNGYEKGHAAYSKGAEHGHGDSARDSGYKQAHDAEGERKYSYFSQGNGPDGYYSRGHFGSEGYEKEKSSGAYEADKYGSGFKKGYESGDDAHAEKHSDYDKANSAKSGYNGAHDVGHHGYQGNAHGYDNHKAGYESSHGGHGHDASGHYAVAKKA